MARLGGADSWHIQITGTVFCKITTISEYELIFAAIDGEKYWKKWLDLNIQFGRIEKILNL
ncbi:MULTISPECIES: hypothetical protein [Aeribacillus]|uniref:Uncharacterized protein n=1 Tax=Aeribacillus pallidus TaxID=33936 RepID=A0A223E6I7_9BACI|nr:hypothetical protein [Aeribacillus pallidus]ASS90887.1 hypothetical protein AP3564_12245 [Aeribacillus pallidus]